MTRQQRHHARIMIECGCSIEDVAVTMGAKLADTIYAIAESLHANPTEQKRVQKMLRSMKLSPPIPVIHTRAIGDDAIQTRLDPMRNAA